MLDVLRRLRRSSAGRLAACVALVTLIGGVAGGADTHLLDQRFTSGHGAIVPMDLTAVDLSLDFDASQGRVTGRARLSFTMPADGRPSFKMGPEPGDVLLDGAPAEVSRVRTPKRGTSVRAVAAELVSGSLHTLEMTYELSRREAEAANGRVGFLSTMSDIGPLGNYFEAYGPSNVEADSYAMTLHIGVHGARGAPRVFANGRVEQVSADPPAWRVEFPSWYTTSSFFVHVTNAPFHVIEGSVGGVERDIPVTVYAKDRRLAEEAMRALPPVFGELEATYGPYVHESFVALIAASGGMEHCGATVTSLEALEHEVTHMWFARGVMPASGRDGWIDEAIASWRDGGYVRREPGPRRRPTVMAGASPFPAFAPGNVYRDGNALLSEIDALAAPGRGGLRPVLARWYGEAKTATVSTEDFLAFLERDTGLELAPLFRRYVTDRTKTSRSRHDRCCVRPVARSELRRVR